MYLLYSSGISFKIPGRLYDIPPRSMWFDFANSNPYCLGCYKPISRSHSKLPYLFMTNNIIILKKNLLS